MRGRARASEARIAKTLAYPAFRARLLGGFAGLALLRAVAGLYGVLSQLVAQRTQEIGIRVALGAQRSVVLALVSVVLAAAAAIAVWLPARRALKIDPLVALRQE